MGILVYCLNLPRPPFHTHQDEARWGGPAHTHSYREVSCLSVFGSITFVHMEEMESWEQNIVDPKLVMQWEDLHKCSKSISEQRPVFISSVSNSSMETTMFLLLFPTQRAKTFKSLQQRPNSPALGANAKVSDVCWRALENLTCCSRAAEDLLCAFSLSIFSSSSSLCPWLRKSWAAPLLYACVTPLGCGQQFLMRNRSPE